MAVDRWLGKTMTFKKNWASNKIVSSEGYVLRFLNRVTIKYEDGPISIYINAEQLGVPRKWAVYFDDMRVGDVHGEPLADEKLRALISGRTKEVFAFLGRTISER